MQVPHSPADRWLVGTLNFDSFHKLDNLIVSSGNDDFPKVVDRDCREKVLAAALIDVLVQTLALLDVARKRSIDSLEDDAEQQLGFHNKNHVDRFYTCFRFDSHTLR